MNEVLKSYTDLEEFEGKTIKTFKYWSNHSITLVFTDDSWITLFAQSTPNLEVQKGGEER